MSVISAKHGDLPADAFFASVMRRSLAPQQQTNVSSFARGVLGWPKESASNYRNDKSNPDYDRVGLACRRRVAPAYRSAHESFVLDASQTLGGPLVLVELVDAIEVPVGTRPGDVLRESIAGIRAFDALVQEVYERVKDGVICADDAAAIAVAWSQAQRQGRRIVTYSQHCCAQRRGGRS